jgi:hypothetical protein
VLGKKNKEIKIQMKEQNREEEAGKEEYSCTITWF